MIFFPNAKINVGLNVISKQSNGYHNLESCFCPINLFDIIEIKKSNTASFKTSGIKIPGKLKENINHFKIPGGDLFRRPVYSSSIIYYRLLYNYR